MRSRISVAFALSVELAAILPLCFHAGRPAWLVAAAVLTHGSASALIAVGVRWRLPAGLRDPRGSVLLALFTLSFLLPVVGALGIGALLIALARPRREVKVEPWVEVRVPELPFRPLALDGRRHSEGYLGAVLRNSPLPAERLRAVMALRQLGVNRAVPLMRLALRDAVDDVRLLAYSMLDAQERTLGVRIRDLERELAALTQPPLSAPAASTSLQATALHAHLAESHFELVWIGVVNGAARRQALERARGHAEAVLAAAADDAGGYLLLGRIQLAEGSIVDADASFVRAREAGLPDAVVAPYRAEVAFRQRRFSDVQRELKSIPSALRAAPMLARLFVYWS